MKIPKIPTLRRFFAFASTIALLLVLVVHFDDILMVLVTPLPQGMKECLREGVTDDVAAQSACSLSPTNSLPAWTTGGRIRETRIFDNWETGLITLTGAQGMRMENTSFKYGFIHSENNLHLSQNAFYDGISWRRITTGRAGGFQTNLNYNEAFRVFSDDSVAANTVNPVNTPRFIVRTNGNIIVNGSTGFGDARMSFNNTNGANDTTIVMRGGPTNNGPVFGIMPWNSEVYLSSGAYYSNFSWVHAFPNASSQILTMQPGSGVLWFASNNNSASWNVAGGSVLWNDQGV